MSQRVKTLGRNDKLSLAHAVMRADRIRHLGFVVTTQAGPEAREPAVTVQLPDGSGRRSA
jgi:hypothetical protein